VYDQAGAEIRTVDINASRSSNATLSGDGRRLATSGSDGVSVIDVETGAVVTHLDCRDCLRLDLSRDGSRLATNSGGEVVLWDVDRGLPLWRERDRAGDEAEPLGVSPDGHRVMWGRDGTVYLRTEGAGDQELRLGEQLKDAALSHDGTRLAVVTHDSVGVWETAGLRPIFRVPSSSWVPQEIHWSQDGSALLDMRDALGTLLLDSSTGQPFASIEVTRPAAFGTNDIVSPRLDYQLSAGDGSWEIAPLPAPDSAPPEESLARLQQEAGLVMHGVELDSAQADYMP
jgi:WD40 repeat protein